MLTIFLMARSFPGNMNNARRPVILLLNKTRQFIDEKNESFIDLFIIILPLFFIKILYFTPKCWDHFDNSSNLHLVIVPLTFFSSPTHSLITLSRSLSHHSYVVAPPVKITGPPNDGRLRVIIKIHVTIINTPLFVNALAALTENRNLPQFDYSALVQDHYT